MDKANCRHLLFYKTSDNAYAPVKASMCSAGYDLRASSDHIIYPIPNKNDPIPTNLKVIIPNGCYGRIASRSGLALKLLDVGGGVVDSDYRGEIFVIMYNYGDAPFVINKGDKIAQIICEKIENVELLEITKK